MLSSGVALSADSASAAIVVAPQAAAALLGAGNKAHADGDVPAAIQMWERVVHEFPNTPSWFKALYNLGIAKQEMRRFREAIAHFAHLTRSNPPNQEEGDNIMENYRNYSHRAALGISQCYEALGEFSAALRWAEFASTRYPYQSWCGTCLMGAAEALRKHIAHLEVKMKSRK